MGQTSEIVLLGELVIAFYSLLLDIGAEISVIPEEAIHSDWLDGETVVMRDANGGSVKRLTANVLLMIGGKQVTCHATVAPLETLGGEPILANGIEFKEYLAMLEKILVRLTLYRLEEWRKARRERNRRVLKKKALLPKTLTQFGKRKMIKW